MTSEGVDVSNNNGGALPDGVQFVWVKASEGSTYDDRFFEGYVAECERRGVPWGPYHFPHPDVTSPDVEAAWFLRNARRGPIGWALDVEKRRTTSGTTIDPMAIMGPVRLAGWCEQFRAIVEPVLGRSWHYTFRNYADQLWPRLTGSWSWWLSTMDGSPHVLDYAGRPVQIEQYTIAGGIDRNLARVPLTSSDPTPAPLGDDMPIFLVIDKDAADPKPQYLTNLINKWHLPGEPVRDELIAMAAFRGAGIITDPGPAPIPLSHAALDAIPDAHAGTGAPGGAVPLKVSIAGTLTGVAEP